MADQSSLIARHAPAAFVMVGVAMIIVAATAGLTDGVAVAFVTLGTVLLALGGLAESLEGPIEVGPAGLKAELQAVDRLRRQALEAKHEAERQNRPEDAKRFGEVAVALDDWFAQFQRELAERPEPNPFLRAARLQSAYDRRHRSPRGEDDEPPRN